MIARLIDEGKHGKFYVGRLEDFPPGHKQAIQTPLEPVLVVNVEGELFAISNICPHAGGYLDYGPLEGYVIECPLHFWPFDVRTGCLVDMNQPSLDDTKLETFSLEIKDGEIYLLLPAT